MHHDFLPFGIALSVKMKTELLIHGNCGRIVIVYAQIDLVFAIFPAQTFQQGENRGLPIPFF